MAPELYGRDALLQGLVPRLVGVAYRGDGGRRPADFRDAGPVVRLVGGRGAGKSAILTDLADAYRQRIPLSLVDLASHDLRPPQPWPVRQSGSGAAWPGGAGGAGPDAAGPPGGDDGEGSDDTEPVDTARRTANTSPVTDLLYTLEKDLRRRPRNFGVPMEFPRLTHGLVAVSGWRADSVREQNEAQRQLWATARSAADSFG